MKVIDYKEIIREGIIASKCVRLNGGGLNRLLLVTLTNKYILSINPLQYQMNDKGELDLIEVTNTPREKLQELESNGSTYFPEFCSTVKYTLSNTQIHEITGKKLIINGEDY